MRLDKKTLAVIGICAPLMTHCGGSSGGGSGGDKPGSAGFTRLTLGNSISQPFDNPSCQQSPRDLNLDQYNFTLYANDDSQQQNSSQSLSSSKDGLQSGIVINTITGQFMNMSVEIIAENGVSRLGFGLESNYRQQNLYMCPSNPIPNRGSREATALSSLALITQAHSFYNSLASAKTLPKVRLNILPDIGITMKIRIADDVKSQDGSAVSASMPQDLNNKELKYAVTDNAAWSLIDEKDKSIQAEFMIFPQSQEAIDSDWFNRQPLWEVPFVMSHEFGHHIFHSYYPKLFEKGYDLKALSQNPLANLFHLPRNRALAAYSFTSALGDTAQASSAINEGFADLFASYAVGDKGGISSVKCMRMTRDTTQSFFYDGISKKLDGEVWKKFTAQENDESSPIDVPQPQDMDCESYDFRDPHIIGAIIAHGVHMLFKEATQNSSDAREKSAAAALTWLTRQNNAIGSVESAESLIRISLEQAFEVAYAMAPEQQQILCEIVKEKFPYFHSQWNQTTAGKISKCY